ncbi:MAG: sugar phosphate isomerase/epimerase [Candidatus Latescibacteria bacterium]|nr:sugar phosphate isomerase/epimerase [Candidatus Latescibacterota bacterium]
MDISFFTGAGGTAWSLDECARWAEENDFDAVRLSASGAADPDKVMREGPDEITGTLKAHGLYLAALAAHSNLLDDDPDKRDAAATRLRKAIETAGLLGAPVVVTHAGSPVGWHFYGQFSSSPGNPGDRSMELVERFRQMYTPIVHFAEECGVKIALDGAVRMGNIACNPEMWERVLDAVPSDHLGLSCDPSHWLWMMILPAEDAIRMFAGKWYYADIKDCEVSPRMLFRQGIIGNWWWQYRVPGRGQLNWGTVTGALLESGYDYVLCIENEDRGMPGLAGFALGCRHLRQFLPRRGEPYDRPSGFWQGGR